MARVRQPSCACPRTSSDPFQVFLNGVEQHEGVDFVVREGRSCSSASSRTEQIGVGRWTSMVLGIAGSYGKNDTVDVVYEREGRPDGRLEAAVRASPA